MTLLRDAFDQAALRVGLTATPDYDADRGLARFFPDLVHELSLGEAFALGLLAPVRAWVAEVDHAGSSVRMAAGDYDRDTLGRLMSSGPYFKAAEAFRYAPSSRAKGALLCCATRQQAHDLHQYLLRHRPPGQVSPSAGALSVPQVYSRSEIGAVTCEFLMRRRIPNPKRRLHPTPQGLDLERLAGLALYGGNPRHKRNPGDFGFRPAADPRDDRTLCDGAGVLARELASRLLHEGLRRGLVSAQLRSGWPQNVWAVAPNGVAVEAMLENEVTGAYHGYPMLMDDPLRDEVLRIWRGA